VRDWLCATVAEEFRVGFCSTSRREKNAPGRARALRHGLYQGKERAESPCLWVRVGAGSFFRSVRAPASTASSKVACKSRAGHRLASSCDADTAYAIPAPSSLVSERILDLVSSPRVTIKPNHSMPSTCPGIPHCSLSPTLKPQYAASSAHHSYIYTCLHPHLHSHPHSHLQICASSARSPIYSHPFALASMPSLSHLTYAALLHRYVSPAPPRLASHIYHLSSISACLPSHCIVQHVILHLIGRLPTPYLLYKYCSDHCIVPIPMGYGDTSVIIPALEQIGQLHTSFYILRAPAYKPCRDHIASIVPTLHDADHAPVSRK